MPWIIGTHSFLPFGQRIFRQEKGGGFSPLFNQFVFDDFAGLEELEVVV